MDKLILNTMLMSDIELTEYRQQLLDTLATHPDDQKAVLLRDYGIRWRSPAVMNPRVMFD